MTRRPPTTLLVCLVLAVTVASVLVNLSVYVLGHGHLYGLVELLDAGRERNVPTLVNFLLLLTSSALCAKVWRRGGIHRRYWLGLSLILALIALDEAVEVHGGAVLLIPELLHVGGGLYLSWILPGVVAASLIGIIFMPFLRGLPPSTRRLFLVAGALYVVSAVGLDWLELPYYLDDGRGRDFGVALMETVEELGEMLALVVFIQAVSSYLRPLRSDSEWLRGASRIEVQRPGVTAPAPSAAAARARPPRRARSRVPPRPAPRG